MASFTTQVCDRCEAHFPLVSNHHGDRPVKKASLEVHGGAKTEVELCKNCREILSNWFYRTFLKGAQ